MIDYPKKGEIYLVRLLSKPKDIKSRPAMVVSLDIRNKLANGSFIYKLKTFSHSCFASIRRGRLSKNIYG